jgi:hypothetical protein
MAEARAPPQGACAPLLGCRSVICNTQAGGARGSSSPFSDVLVEV